MILLLMALILLMLGFAATNIAESVVPPIIALIVVTILAWSGMYTITSNVVERHAELSKEIEGKLCIDEKTRRKIVVVNKSIKYYQEWNYSLFEEAVCDVVDFLDPIPIPKICKK